MNMLPEIYNEMANKYPCTADDLWKISQDGDPRIIEASARLLGQGYLWWQVKEMMMMLGR